MSKPRQNPQEQTAVNPETEALQPPPASPDYPLDFYGRMEECERAVKILSEKMGELRVMIDEIAVEFLAFKQVAPAGEPGIVALASEVTKLMLWKEKLEAAGFDIDRKKS